MKPKRSTLRHIVRAKGKETTFSTARGEKLVIHKGNPIRLSADLSEETL